MTNLSTTAEPAGKDQVKLRVEVPEAALDPAMGAVYSRWAKQIKVPGFRKGKVPRQLIDSRVGGEAIREEALRDALPELYRDALKAEELDAIAPPDIEVTQWEPGSPLIFEATVDVRPQIDLPDLATLRIEAPDTEVSDSEIDEQLQRLQDRFAELESVGRPVMRGDHVLIDLKGTRNDEPVEGMSAPDFLYEVGSGGGPPSLDGQLEGERPGAILKFSDDVVIPSIGGEPVTVSFSVMVKEVKAKKLPELDDEFAKTVGEFESLDDLRKDLRERISEYKGQLVEQELRSRALQALVEASDLEPPEKLVDSEAQHRLAHIEEDLKRAGMTMEQFSERSGTTELSLRGDIRTEAAKSVKAELLLEEIARGERFEVGEEDIGTEIAYAAARAQRDPKEVAEQLVKEGRLGSLAADIIRRKALDHVVATAQVIGFPTSTEEGQDRQEEPASAEG